MSDEDPDDPRLGLQEVEEEMVAEAMEVDEAKAHESAERVKVESEVAMEAEVPVEEADLEARNDPAVDGLPEEAATEPEGPRSGEEIIEDAADGGVEVIEGIEVTEGIESIKSMEGFEGIEGRDVIEGIEGIEEIEGAEIFGGLEAIEESGGVKVVDGAEGVVVDKSGEELSNAGEGEEGEGVEGEGEGSGKMQEAGSGDAKSVAEIEDGYEGAAGEYEDGGNEQASDNGGDGGHGGDGRDVEPEAVEGDRGDGGDVDHFEVEDAVDDLMSVVAEESESQVSVVGASSEVIVEVLPPQGFTLRRAPNEFTLDREFDENELMGGLIDAPSVASFGDSLTLTVTTAPSAEVSGGGLLSSVDRDALLERHRALTAERAHLQRVNSVLQRRLHDHYKRRKMANMFRVAEEVSAEAEAVYARALATFGTAQSDDAELQACAAEGLGRLAEGEAHNAQALQSTLDALLDMERVNGVGLVDSKCGRVLTEKAVDALMHRQSARVRELVEQRIAFIRLRDGVDVREAAIRDLEDLGEGAKLGEYEQLRIELQNLNDKIEEREDECARIRARTENLRTAFAHLREKSCAVEAQIEHRDEMLDMRQDRLDVLRVELTKQKTLRDKLRLELRTETTDAGLLTKPHLLRDYEDTLDARDALRAQLEDLRAQAAAELRQLTAVRYECERSAAHGEAAHGVARSPTYKEVVTRRLEQRQAGREAAVASGVERRDQEDDIFQL